MASIRFVMGIINHMLQQAYPDFFPLLSLGQVTATGLAYRGIF